MSEAQDTPNPSLTDVSTDGLDFRAERDRRTESWERADPSEALIERASRFAYRVMLKGGDAHLVALAYEEGRYVGRCDCKGFEYHDGPCAHLCTLRKAEFIDAVDVEYVDSLDDQHAAAQGTGEVFADGGVADGR
ncbi:hypothetical protein [Halostella salina]|uniref:hypothetical protein n=1 Tax=Halostella salina TaxID=1547897 RepID=UPI001969BB94|nr:hypothetical protein [Halostella salina]